ncbi:hypothetical protein IMCC21224_112089 [Puniceibacterium sp. IMCC21224]|nr:hypothetical protein IMCC21224_112089 [Puniceibacterium sp. IMCC21224]
MDARLYEKARVKLVALAKDLAARTSPSWTAATVDTVSEQPMC